MRSTKDAKMTKELPENGVVGANSRPSFVRYRLTEAELAQARNACLELGDLGGIIEQFIEEGYKFSAGFDSYGGGIQAFITPAKKGMVNEGWTLTARAPDVRLAIGMLAFKHYTLFDQTWPKDAPQNKGETWG